MRGTHIKGHDKGEPHEGTQCYDDEMEQQTDYTAGDVTSIMAGEETAKIAKDLPPHTDTSIVQDQDLQRLIGQFRDQHGTAPHQHAQTPANISSTQYNPVDISATMGGYPGRSAAQNTTKQLRQRMNAILDSEKRADSEDPRHPTLRTLPKDLNGDLPDENHPRNGQLNPAAVAELQEIIGLLKIENQALREENSDSRKRIRQLEFDNEQLLKRQTQMD